MAGEIKTGDVFCVRYPFVRKHVDEHFGGCFAEKGPHFWMPGVGHRPCSPEDSEAVANGEGWQILTVVSTHKPGRFPTRVFYTQQWEDPDGKAFGRQSCRVLTEQAFRARAAGFGVNVGGIEYAVDPEWSEGDV
jgi:hypothetical protein